VVRSVCARPSARISGSAEVADPLRKRLLEPARAPRHHPGIGGFADFVAALVAVAVDARSPWRVGIGRRQRLHAVGQPSTPRNHRRHAARQYHAQSVIAADDRHILDHQRDLHELDRGHTNDVALATAAPGDQRTLFRHARPHRLQPEDYAPIKPAHSIPPHSRCAGG